LAIDPQLTADDLKFLELYNTTSLPIDLSDWRIRGSVEFDLTPGTRLDAGATLVLASFDVTSPANANRLNAFRAQYGIDASVALLGGYAGQLDDRSGHVVLQQIDRSSPGDPAQAWYVLEDEVPYDDAAPWPPALAGSWQRNIPASWPGTPSAWTFAAPTAGFVNASGSADFNADGRVDAADVDALCGQVLLGNDAAAYDLNRDGSVDAADFDWMISQVLHTDAGDSNLDGRFNSSDLVLVFQFGQYEDNVARNSGWAQGDWSCDGEFSSHDIVLAFQSGTYSAEVRAGRVDAAVASFVVELERLGSNAAGAQRPSVGGLAAFTPATPSPPRVAEVARLWLERHELPSHLPPRSSQQCDENACDMGSRPSTLLSVEQHSETVSSQLGLDAAWADWNGDEDDRWELMGACDR
jgi:hypothetical protein